MKRYQVYPQVGKGLRTVGSADSTIGGGISACYWKGYDTRGYRPYVMEIYDKEQPIKPKGYGQQRND